jgi:hypothetical protein
MLETGVKKMARLKKVWCADIMRSNGQIVQYRLTMDLQLALNSDLSGQSEMQNALIVIPLAPYRNHRPNSHQAKSKSANQPPYGIGLVKKIYRLRAGQAYRLQVARSQFIGHQYWSVRPFQPCNRYLRHDYPWLSQKQIAADITYWQKRLFKDKPHQNWWWKLVSNLRIRFQLTRIKQDNYVKERKKWLM